MSLDRYEFTELLAVAWNDEMAQRFPNANHTKCRQEMRHDGTSWIPHDPPRCHGWHCNRCGAATNSYGHHNCPDRPQRQENHR
ncbi:hypothetical protein SEA_TAPIOCA_64 [Mycobacterium phage Tapioca]|uniref:Uncharacterized protein n=12 Tax=Caudoviricetes TaxID=2731619 RepID=A0A142K7Y7_9CAUD|nr:hypothetical protein FDI84_gp67 [Mycobacterium phage Pipsqueaks]YP_010051930.1 hypothetical protein KD928_gp66 [Mycobacterium phage Philonius]YP_010051998.1 hypothetical protein KD929_gp62 [Mycobacterium phage Aggie]YP_010052201.1 hypothetical protein KD932_gp64 [Mycobacterium phage Fulbright]YP_010052337.1 hypothetical protein KD934_gp64 [Mycobacterium phage Tapioca]AMS02012.1 hypothetical protein SEA_XERXES_66 [Mycobacterium phage Xerxes]AWY04148.1 hypothetical protein SILVAFIGHTER_68 [M